MFTAERNQNRPAGGKVGAGDAGSPPEPTWVHEIFQGILTSETRCLNCETVSSKDEDFFDLQVDVDQNTSITHCLKCFSNTETLCSDNKFKCDHCSSYQEAQVYENVVTVTTLFRQSNNNNGLSIIFFPETHEGEKAADDISSAFKKVQICRAVQSTHQSFSQSSLPFGAEAL